MSIKNFLAQYQVPISKVYILLLLKENMMIKLKKVILFLKVQKKGLN